MKGRGNPIANLIMLAAAILAFVAWVAAGVLAAVVIFAMGFYVGLSPRLLKEWERAVLLRLGRFQRVLGPGINWTFPGFDRLAATVGLALDAARPSGWNSIRWSTAARAKSTGSLVWLRSIVTSVRISSGWLRASCHSPVA